MYNKTDFLRSLLEAEDTLDTEEPVEKKTSASDDKDDSNKDIKNDSKDVSSEKDDFSDEGKSDDNLDDTADDSANDETDDSTSDSTDGSDSGDAELDGESDDNDSEEDDAESIIEKRKKLNLYGLFSNLVVSFKNLDEAFEKIANLDLPPSNAKFINEVKNKLTFDIESLNELILDLNSFTVRTYVELLAIYKIYYSDLRTMGDVLKLFMKADQNFSKIVSKASSKSSVKRK